MLITAALIKSQHKAFFPEKFNPRGLAGEVSLTVGEPVSG